MPKKYPPDERVIVISCEVDKAVCKTAIAANTPIVTAEFILTGILKQELNIDAYPLSE